MIRVFIAVFFCVSLYVMRLAGRLVAKLSKLRCLAYSIPAYILQFVVDGVSDCAFSEN